MTQQCSKCKITKSLDSFYKSKHTNSGLQYTCKLCQSKRQRNNPKIYIACEICSKKFVKSKNSKNTKCKECTLEAILEKHDGHSHNYNGTKYFAGRLISGWKHSAARRGHIWDLSKVQLDEIFLKQNNKCALSGIMFEFNKKSKYRPSIDRVDSSKGYTYDNVQFVCVMVNTMKNQFDQTEFIKMCKNIADNNKELF